MINDIAIVGMGALGLLYGEHLAAALGRESVRFVMDEQRYARHKNDIYTVNGKVQQFALQSAADAQPADLVIVATKYSGLAEAMEEMTGLVDEHTVIISVLNGISSEEKLMQRFGEQNVVHCVALGMDAVREGTALTYQHKGILKIGCLSDKQRPALAAVTELLQRAVLPHTVEKDIMHALWAKLLLNVGINQTCMVYETNYGGALAQDEARRQMFAAMHEVISVAVKEGVSLTEDDFTTSVQVISGLAPEGTPSMRQDALARRPSEVELFAGTIVALGKKHGVPTPVNQYYYDCIKKIESQY